MRNSFFLLLIIFFAACNNSSDKNEAVKTDTVTAQIKKDSALNYIHNFSDTALENKITAVLLKLPFVIKSSNYIDSFSNHKHAIAFLLENPETSEAAIFVKAGYNGDERFETYYQFYVNPKTLEIKVYDPVADKKLSLKEYSKTQK